MFESFGYRRCPSLDWKRIKFSRLYRWASLKLKRCPRDAIRRTRGRDVEPDMPPRFMAARLMAWLYDRCEGLNRLGAGPRPWKTSPRCPGSAASHRTGQNRTGDSACEPVVERWSDHFDLSLSAVSQEEIRGSQCRSSRTRAFEISDDADKLFCTRDIRQR